MCFGLALMTFRSGVAQRALWGTAALFQTFALTTISAAADLEPSSLPAVPMYAPSMYSPVRVQNWSGFSLGGFAGGGLGQSSQTYTDNTFSTGEYKIFGAVAGVHAGLDYQRGNWVWGQGADFQWSSIGATINRATPGNIPTTFSTRLNWLTATYIRLGYSLDRLLPYVIAGPAFGSVNVGGVFPTAGKASQSSTWLGWQLGFGVEYALSDNLIAKAEYLYVCLGETIQFHSDNAEYMSHLFRVGLDYKFDWNPTINSPEVSAGKQLVPGQIHTWTGSYVGFNIGGLTGKLDTTYTFGGSAFVGLHGMAGVQGGYNWQARNYFVGVESDIQGTGQSNNWRSFVSTGGVRAEVNATQSMPVLFTFRGRAGYASDQWLFYGTGGFAYGEVRSTTSITVPGVGSVSPDLVRSRGGWTVGAGVETTLWPGWTGKFEYLFVDLGGFNESFTGIGPLPLVNVSTTVRDNSLRMGLNYAIN
jgi:outer membrane immunogenic protein